MTCFSITSRGVPRGMEITLIVQKSPRLRPPAPAPPSESPGAGPREQSSFPWPKRRPFQCILQLSDVSRPMVLEHDIQGFRGNPLNFFIVLLLERFPGNGGPEGEYPPPVPAEGGRVRVITLSREKRSSRKAFRSRRPPKDSYWWPPPGAHPPGWSWSLPGVRTLPLGEPAEV